MSYNALDFGTSANNDGESLFAAFTKVDAMLAELYVSDGEITHAVTDVASAATCDIGAAATDRVRITGTTGITSLGTVVSRLRFVHFAGVLTLTHHATSLILLGGANITTADGDTAIFSSDGSGNWRMLTFNRAAALGSGDFVGPASATDNAIVRFDGAGGKTGQNSAISIDDTGVLAPITTDAGSLGSASLMWSDLFLALGAVVNWNNGDVTLTHAANTLTFAGASSGYQVDALVAPSVNDGAPLGSTSLMWSDLFLALGAVINFNNGDVTLTHAANTLTFGGASSGYQFDALAAPSVSDGAALGSTALMWADLFLASGAVVNFNNGDVTLTHSANTLAVAGGTLTTEELTASALVTASVAGNAARLVNTSDSASVQVARLEGDRATMADADEAYISLMLSNDGGTQTEFARLTWIASDVNVGTSVDGALQWSTAIAGTVTAMLKLEGSALTPAASDGTALGSTSLMWADLFLASGGVINWNNGDVTATHSANALAFAGASSGYTFDAVVTPAASDGAALGTSTVMWSDLFLASGSVINFDNGDVTFTHAANTLTMAGGTLVLPDSGLQMGASNPFSDSAGTLTLQNVDALDATTETTIEAAIDTLANLTTIQGLTVTLADANLDVLFGWDDSGAAYKNFALADILTEGAPAAGDFLVIYGAEGDLRKVNWSSLPGAGAGISNVVEDATPELGGDLESNNNDIKMEQFSADAVAADIYFQKSRHAAIGSHTVVVADDDLGKIIFQGSDGTNFESAAQIRGEVDGTPGNDDMPGRLVFSTTADGSATLTDRLILDAAGILKPNANDGVALGTGTLSYADLFLASGAVINFNNGNYTVTHSAGLLTTNGALSIGTSNALTCGTIELGAASDTTIARSAAGVLTVEGTVLLKGGVHSIWIPAHAMIARTTNGAAPSTLEMTTNKNMFKTQDFDTTTQEFAQLFIQMPKSWDEGTVTFNPVWSHASTVTNFGVVFGLAGVALSDDDAGDVAFGTAQTSTDTGGTTNDIYIGPTSSAITIAGTPAESDYVMFQINRTVADGGDTLAIDARLHGIILNYTVAAANDA